MKRSTSCDEKNEFSIRDIIEKSSSLPIAMQTVLDHDNENWIYLSQVSLAWKTLKAETLKAETTSSHKPRQIRSKYILDRPWQKELASLITPDIKANMRTIVWIYERKGNTGKSAMARWLKEENPSCWIVCDSPKSLLLYGRKVIPNTWTGYGAIFDLHRKSEMWNEEFCEKLADIKNGELGNYEHPSPHVIVFANWMPKILSISLDRWDIRHIESDGSMTKISPKQIISNKVMSKMDGEKMRYDDI
jgi:hypothetical protein